METVSVETSRGRVVGTRAGGVRAFRGIPSAAPLGPDRRFLPPEPPPAAGEIDATRFGPAAPQNPDKLDPLWGATLAPGAEDCLTLNVWAPEPDGPPRPVLVWVHGGGFIIGSGPWGWHDGANLARRGGLVVVSFNYRLGVLGFLDLGETAGPDYAASGNLGLLDQIRALEWVREHVAAFGGDPGNVTVCGESAGAMSVACLLASPRATGLFRRAVCMSGGGNFVRSPEFARAVTRRFLDRTGAKTVDDLRRRSVPDLLAAQRALLRETDFGGPLFGPTMDGDVLPDWPLNRIRAGAAADVSLLVGSTRDEFRLWGLYVPALRALPPRALVPWLTRVFGDPRKAHALAASYRREYPGTTGTMAVLGDYLFRLPALRVVEAQLAHRSDTRVYRFDWPTPVQGGWLGAAHALDSAILFGNLDAPEVQRFTGTGPERRAGSAAMQDAWAAFARTGDPYHPGLPPWPAYDTTSRRTMLIATAPHVAEDPAGPEREAWGALPFDGRTPPITELPRRRELRWFLLRRLLVWTAVAAVGALLLGLLARISAR